ncbi:MAG: response regulator [Desulforhopalus sp.]
MNEIRILVVDDDSIIREVLVNCLQLHGFEASAGASGEEAVRALASKHFDVIITDLVMDGIDGHEVARHCRRLGHDSLLIMMTGKCQKDTRARALASGVDVFFCKPFSVDELLEVLSSSQPARDPGCHLAR